LRSPCLFIARSLRKFCATVKFRLRFALDSVVALGIAVIAPVFFRLPRRPADTAGAAHFTRVFRKMHIVSRPSHEAASSEVACRSPSWSMVQVSTVASSSRTLQVAVQLNVVAVAAMVYV